MNPLFRPFLTVSILIIATVYLPFAAQIFSLLQEKGTDEHLLAYLTGSSYLHSLTNSLLIGTCTACLAGALGTVQAVLLQRVKFFGASFFSLLYFIPFLIPSYIHAIIWSKLLSTEGRGSILYSVLYSPAGVIFILTITYAPLVTAVVRAGLRALDRSQEDAASLSASSVKVMLRITLPRLYPHIISSSLVVMLLAMANYDVPDLLRIKVLPVEIFIQLSAMYDETGALLLALPYLLVTGILIFLVGKMTERQRFTKKSSAASPKLIYNNLARICIVLLQLILFTFALFIPLAVLLIEASAVENIWLILNDSLPAITYTLLLSGCSAAVALCCAFPLSYLLARQHPLRNSINVMALIPFVLPGVLVGLSLIQLGNLPLFFRLHSTSFFCAAALVSHFLFIAVKILQAGIEQIPAATEEVAACVRGNKRKVIHVILLPQLLPVLINSFFIVFICSFGELSAMLLLVPPGRETVALKIYNMMHYGAEDIVAVLCLIITLILFCSGWLVLLCQKIIRSHFLKSVH